MWLAILHPRTKSKWANSASSSKVWEFSIFTQTVHTPASSPTGQKDGPAKVSNMPVARRQSFPFPWGLISLGNGMPQGTMVINYIVSCSQAVASQEKKKKSKNLSGFICKYRSIGDNCPNKSTAASRHINLFMSTKLLLFLLLYPTHLSLISFLQRFSSSWLISKEIVWEFSAKAVSMVTEKSH